MRTAWAMQQLPHCKASIKAATASCNISIRFLPPTTFLSKMFLPSWISKLRPSKAPLTNSSRKLINNWIGGSSRVHRTFMPSSTQTLARLIPPLLGYEIMWKVCKVARSALWKHWSSIGCWVRTTSILLVSFPTLWKRRRIYWKPSIRPLFLRSMTIQRTPNTWAANWMRPSILCLSPIPASRQSVC